MTVRARARVCVYVCVCVCVCHSYIFVTGGAWLNPPSAGVFLAASEANYPGGVALHELHTSVYRAATDLHAQPTIRVHIDAAAAMQGVTRFGELGGRWQYVHPMCIVIVANADWYLGGASIRYSKDESLTVASQFKGFDFCIIADADKLGEYFDVSKS